jgi:3',5'-cyclic AMP phosphodiesterase CpdA
MRRLAPCLALFLLSGCRSFEYSPAIDVGEKPRYNVLNLERLAADGGPRLRGRIAVLADAHQYYDEMKAAVTRINSDSAIDFVVVAGDVTKYGYDLEYRWFADILRGLRAPVIVAIGNHDVQAEGKTLYEKFFGPTDFAFAWRGYEFVIFDDNAREFSGGVPDWDWLEDALAAAGDSLRVIPVCHAPPFTDQLDSAQSARLVGLYSRFRAAIVIGGHTHRYAYGEPYGDGIPYLVADDIGGRNFVLLTLDGGTPTVERVFF